MQEKCDTKLTQCCVTLFVPWGTDPIKEAMELSSRIAEIKERFKLVRPFLRGWIIVRPRNQ